MSLISAFISHQIWLQRNATSEVGELRPFIEQMRKEVKQAVLAFGDESRTKAKLTKTLKDLTETLYAIGNDWDAKLVADLQELAKYEAKWTAETMADSTGVNFTTPTPEQVWSAVKFNPLALDGKPVDFTKLMIGWEETEVARLVQGVKSGFVQGLTTRQIVKNVVGPGGLGDVSERHAATVVRTALNHVSTQARLMTLEKNSDVVERYEWVSTLDSRTSTTCFTGETELAPIAGMDAIMRGSYSGEVITVELANGKKFTGTPEHPILTQYGWTPLKEIDPREHILYTITDETIVLEVVQGVNMPARADDIFDTFADFSTGEMVTTSPTAADFYGDGVRLNGEIDIVRTNCKLRNYINTRSREQTGNVPLGSVHAAGMLPRDSSKHPFLLREFAGDMPALNEVELFNKTVENCFADASRPDALGGRHSAGEQLDSPFLVGERVVTDPAPRPMLHESELLEKCSDGSSGGAILLGNDASGHPITVRGTNIISVRSELKTCHVYTLSSGQGYYTAGSAIVKNCRARDGQKYEFGKGPLPPAHPGCRSSIAPVVSSEFDFLDAGAKRAARGADGGMQIDANTSYYDFLRQQPAWFQDQALGPVRGAIFRNAGMTPEEFRVASVDGFGRPLTLKEMAAIDKRVRDYLKGE